MSWRTQEPDFTFRLADNAEPQGDVLSALSDLLIDLKDHTAVQEPRGSTPPAERETKKPRTIGTGSYASQPRSVAGWRSEVSSCYHRS